MRFHDTMKSTLGEFGADTRGNFAVLTAAALSVMAVTEG